MGDNDLLLMLDLALSEGEERLEGIVDENDRNSMGGTMKSLTCQDQSLNCSGENCGACINRNIIAKEGYALIQTIERIPASQEQTNAVIAAERFIKIAETAMQKAGIEFFSNSLRQLADEMTSRCTDGASVGVIKGYARRLRQLSDV